MEGNNISYFFSIFYLLDKLYWSYSVLVVQEDYLNN